MNRYQKGGLKNRKEISEKCAQLFDGHSDILQELSYFLTSEIPNLVPKKERVQRVSSKFLVDDGGLEKRDRDKRKRDGNVEFDETNNNFFQFSELAASRDKLETMVAPIVANMVDKLPQKDPELIKEFVHDFVGFCKYVEAHDRDLTADKQKKEERKRRKLDKKKKQKEQEKGGKLLIGELEKISNGCPLVTAAREKPEEKSAMSDCLVSENFADSKEKALNIYEEKRFELDRVLNPLRSAIENTEKLQNLIPENTALALETPIDLEKYFTTLDLKCIQSVYGDQHEDVRDILSRDITVGLSVALTRMKCKREEMEHEIVRLREKLKSCLQFCGENPSFDPDIRFWDSL
ncbi:hypothetical protein FEM48_Zijuj07G0042400 [Ziziphus jujuba var. spinosa]|uniref:Uncharacterized protein n=1 Tax=Ziziphus jujuba var. spinosa TaxID=714518 RepID=A0A978V2D8_ZIZJJ|nr:hypothetical protein FEM48_Zijuj07G0042400 [Ziziphus jujuba var. spinosa]